MDDEATYQVSWSNQALAALVTIAGRAVTRGLGSDLARSLRAIQERLQDAPDSLGEVYRSRGAIREHIAAQDLVSINFAVDTVRHIVIVRECYASSRLDP